MTGTTATAEEFNMSELSPLPAQWTVVRLGELIEEVRDKNKSNIPYPVFTVSNIHGLTLSDEFFDKRVYSKKLNTYKVVCSGYFAYNPYRVNVGSIALFRHDMGLVSPAYVVFKVSNPAQLHSDFLYRLIKSTPYLSEIRRVAMSRGSVRRSLSYRDLSDFRIPLPPLPEQKKIAHVLSTVQAAIEKIEAVIGAARDLKKSLMRHLFTYGPVPLSEAENVLLKDTGIGPVPGHWEVVRLGELSEIRYGLGQPPASSITGIPIIRATNIKRGKIELAGLLRVNPEALPLTRKPFLKNGDIIVVRSGAYTGDVALITPEWENSVAGYDLVVSPGQAVHSPYLAQLLLSTRIQGYFRSQRDRSAQPHLNAYQLATTLVQVPHITEQEQIALVLSRVDQKIEVEEDRKTALQALFKTMLSNLTTGKVRANGLEVPV